LRVESASVNGEAKGMMHARRRALSVAQYSIVFLRQCAAGAGDQADLGMSATRARARRGKLTRRRERASSPSVVRSTPPWGSQPQCTDGVSSPCRGLGPRRPTTDPIGRGRHIEARVSSRPGWHHHCSVPANVQGGSAIPLDWGQMTHQPVVLTRTYRAIQLRPKIRGAGRARRRPYPFRQGR
jgi:hypothetical protein